MKITNILIVSASIGLFAATLQAQGLVGTAPGMSTSQGTGAKSAKPKHPNSINARQNKQEKRIEKGVASGMTNTEATKRADGELTGKERAKIQKDLKKSNKAIKKQKHDKQKD